MTRFIASSRHNPCPVCGRTKDGDCRILNDGKVFCQTKANEQIGKESNGFRFAKSNDDGRTGTWIPVEQWTESPRKTETFYSTRKEWWYQNRTGQNALAYVRDGFWKGQMEGIPGRSISELKSDLLLYRIQEALANNSTYLYWTEGEKCADKLWELGLPAVTSNGGCSGFRPERDANQIPKDITIVLCPDRDQPGIKYMQKVAAAYPENPKLWLRVWPDEVKYWTEQCPKSGGLDVFDWLDGVEPQKAKTMIEQATSDQPIILPSGQGFDQSILEIQRAHEALREFAIELQKVESSLRPTMMHKRAKELNTPLSKFQCQKYLKEGDRIARGIKPKFKITPIKFDLTEQDYLLHEIFPLHSQTLLVGGPKLGKTSLVLQMILKLFCREEKFLGKKLINKKVKVYIVGTDQSQKDWSKMLLQNGFGEDPGDGSFPIRYLSCMEDEVVLTPDSIEKLRDMIKGDLAEGEEALLIIDSFDACIRAIGYEESDADLASPLRQLTAAFHQMPVTQIILHHETKSAPPGVNAFVAQRGHGSIAATVSCGIRLERINPDNPESGIKMRVTSRCAAEEVLMIERAPNGQFQSVGNAAEVMKAEFMSNEESKLIDLHHQVLEMLRQATNYGEPMTAAELATTNLIDTKHQGTARTDRARQILQSLESKGFAFTTQKQVGAGRPSIAWYATEIPGVWAKETPLHHESMS